MASVVCSLLVIFIEYCRIIKLLKVFHSWVIGWSLPSHGLEEKALDLEEVLLMTSLIGKKVEGATNNNSFSSVVLPRKGAK